MCRSFLVVDLDLRWGTTGGMWGRRGKWWRNPTTDAALVTMVRRFKGVSRLNLTGCDQLTKAGLLSLADECAEELSVVESLHVFTHSIGHYARGTREQVSQALVEPAALNSFTASMPRLATLDFGYTHRLDDDAMATLLSQCPRLHQFFGYFSLSFCTALLAPSRCPGLTVVDFGSVMIGVSGISDAMLVSMAKSCSGLKEVGLSRCRAISIVGMTAGNPLFGSYASAQFLV
jgi:hypothetical protein